MADPQTAVARIESGNEESKNEESSSSYESSGPRDEDYILVEEVYEH
jgi:hypothetical protein